LTAYATFAASAAPARKVDLYRRRAEVRERRMRDPAGALDELLGAFRLAPDDAPLYAEVLRLAEKTGRYEQLLEVETLRFHRAAGEQQLQIALEAAQLVEEKLKDPVRAFRAYLRALQLQPDSARTTTELWRLARQIGEISDVVATPPPPPPVRPKLPPPVARS